jgi:hypothetical protein
MIPPLGASGPLYRAELRGRGAVKGLAASLAAERIFLCKTGT